MSEACGEIFAKRNNVHCFNNAQIRRRGGKKSVGKIPSKLDI